MAEPPATSTDYCLRDAAGFCRIGLLGGDCPALRRYPRAPKPCFRSADEAEAALWAAVEKCRAAR